MGNLIAIIFSIVLGAAATALTLVYLGSGFSDKSADIKAQQFLQAGSQIESAMTVFKAENAKTAFTSIAADTTDLAETINTLDQLVKDTPVASQGSYNLEKTGTGIFLVAKKTDDSQDPISADVCTALVDMGGIKIKLDATKTDTEKALGDYRYGCIENKDDTNLYLAYKVE